jgi:hypothetical protein
MIRDLCLALVVGWLLGQAAGCAVLPDAAPPAVR